MKVTIRLAEFGSSASPTTLDSWVMPHHYDHEEINKEPNNYSISTETLSLIKMTSLSTSDLFNVKGRVAVVTGGSSGIGLMISKVRCRFGIP